MKYTALVLLSAVALAKSEDNGLYPNGCPRDWSVEQLLPHPDCHKFYQCWDGNLVEQTCPSNLYFNVEANQCEWTNDHNCTAVYVPEKESEEASNGGDNNGGAGNGDNNGGAGNGDNNGDSDNGNDGQNAGAGNCDPSKAPEICAAEGSNDVLVAHEKCNKYYICDHGIPIPRICPAGLFFNPQIDRCDWPEKVDCGDRLIPDGNNNDNDNNGGGDDNNGGGSDGNGNGGEGNGDNNNGDNNVGAGNCDPSQAPEICEAPGSGGVLVAHEKCNKYYICNQGVPVARPCPAGLFFNPQTDRCDWPQNVDCGDRVIPDGDSEDNNGSDNGGNGNDSNDNGSDGNGNDGQNVGAGNCDPSEAPEICAAPESNGVLVAHEKCNKYYICNHGVPVARPCLAGLLFDPQTDRCDWPQNVDCGDRVIPDGDSEDNNGSDNGGNGNDSNDNGSDGNGNDGQNVGAGNCDPSEAPEICAAPESNGVLVAHEKCNKYYICNHGVPVARPCPAGLLFDPQTDRCDWPQNVDCGDRVIPDGDSEDNNGSDNGGNGNDSNDNGSDGNGNDGQNVGAGNCDPSEAPEICAAPESNGVLVAHEKCNKYYICNHGVPVARPCPAGLLFDPQTDRCDWPQNVDCGDRVIPDGDSEDNNGSDNGGNGNDSNDNGSDGNGNDGQNVGAGNCDPSEAPEICAAPESNGVLVAHEKCNKYYICNHGVPVARPCPAGLLFDPQTDRCDWPQNVDCGDRIIPEGDNNGSDNGSDGNGNNGSNGGDSNGSDNGSGSNGSGDNNNQNGTCNCNPGEAPEICAAPGSSGVLVAHEKCNKYYICNHGTPLPRPCASGLLFNPLTEQCDWPSNVDCGDRIIPDSDEEDNDSGNGDNDNNGSDGNDINGGESNGNGNGTGGNGSGDNNNQNGTCNCNPGEAPEICAAPGSGGVLVAHEKCNKYYICNHGTPLPRPCASGLLYNPLTEQCDWPSNVDCGDRIIPDSDEEDNDSGNGDNDNNGSDGNDINGGESNGNGNGTGGNGSGDNNNQNGTCNCNPGEAPEICAAPGSGGVLVAHEKCNKYYICNHGTPLPRPCASGLLFNPLTEQCDWPSNVDCGDRIVPDSDEEDNDSGNGDNDNNGSDGNDINGGESNSNGNGTGGNGSGDNNNQNGTCNCNPGEAPEICAAPGSGGVLVAHEKCNKYYICNHGTPLPRPCASGLLFNPLTEQCDWPSNVDCGDRIVPDSDEEDNDIGNGDNDNNGSDGNDINEGESNGNGNGTGGNGSGDNNNQNGTCNCNPGEAPEICAAPGSGGVLVAHEKCNKYYICNHGTPLPRPCASGLLYNPLTEQCDWPSNIDCGDRIIPDSDEEDNDSGNGDNDNNGSDGNDTNGGESNGNGNGTGGNGSGDNNNQNGTCNCNPGEAPEICAAPGSGGVLVAHEKCNKYYICNHGTPLPRPCASGLLFNPLTEQCDWPSNVDCGDRIIPDSDEEDNESGNGDNDNNGSDGNDINGGESNGNDNGTGGNGNGDNNNQNGTCNCNPGEAPEICAAPGSGGVLVAHEKCNKYYICNHGTPLARPCASGLLYNPLTEQCDWPSNVDCGDRIIPQEDNQESNNNSDANEGNDGNDNGNDNNDNGNNSNDNNNVSDSGNTGNDSNHEDCDDEEEQNVSTCNCDPSEAPQICAAARAVGVHVAHEQCNKYYICSNGVPVPRSCATGLFFNPLIERCDWPRNVECGDRIVGEDSEENGNVNNNQSIGAGHSDPSKAPEICGAPGSGGVHVAHEACNRYYVCNHGIPVARPCQGGLVFNPNTDSCDWPTNVDCGNRVILDDDSVENDNNGNNNQNVGAGNNEPSLAPTICADERSNGVFVAHEECNKFYTCTNGKPVPISCPSYLLFNPFTDKCDWPNTVDCGDRLNPTDIGVCNCNPRLAPKICSTEGSNTVFIAHEKCNRFYECSNGKPESFRCPSNLVFNPYKEECDWPENVDCIGREIDVEDSESGNPGHDSAGENNDPSLAPVICADKKSDGVLVAHEQCNNFYMCSNGEPVVLRCPANLFFNPSTDQCDWPQFVDCSNRLVPSGFETSLNKHLGARHTYVRWL